VLQRPDPPGGLPVGVVAGPAPGCAVDPGGDLGEAPRTKDVGVLLELVAAAGEAYEQLIAEHVEYAEQILTAYIERHRSGAA